MFAIALALLTALLPACPTEDASNCYWDASTNGGHSFVDVGGTAYYLD